MAAELNPDAIIVPQETDTLVITPLGAGQEVGRSCIILEFQNKKIMLDCGIHPALAGLQALPFIDNIDPNEIDLLLVTHFHIDHCGALPWFLLKTSFKGRCFMTHATKAIYRLVVGDSVKVSNASTERMFYNESDVECSMEKIETIDFHEEKEVDGIKFCCYNAGHVLGAAMFMIEIAGIKVLYTGDFSRQENRHLMAAEIPNFRPDVLIIESTHGIRVEEKLSEREARFTTFVHDIVNRGGRCLIPVFALGPVQELLLIIDEYWSNHPELHDIPIYYASLLAEKCMNVYQTFINAMNDKIRQQITTLDNPFVFKHVSNLNSIDHFENAGPCVVMATPGMMQTGLSRRLFESWCTDPKNGVIVAGYCVDGTLAKHILSNPEEITTMTGQNLPLKMSVDSVSFSAHADYQQTSEFIRILKPPHIVLVHGEPNEMDNLKTAINCKYNDDPDVHIEVYNPRNGQPVELYFQGEKTATVLGSLTDQPAETGRILSGVLVKRNFSYHLLAPSDLSKYTDIVMNTVSQRLSIPFSGNFFVLYFHLNQISEEVKLMPGDEEFDGKFTLQAFNAIKIFHEPKVAILEWSASPVNDMYADAVIAAILKAEKAELTRKPLPYVLKFDTMHFTKCIIDMLADMFGDYSISKTIQDEKLTLTIDNKSAIINISTLEVNCEDDEVLQQMVSSVVMKLHKCLMHQGVGIDIMSNS